MGTHISRVKSVDLDAWTDEQMQNVLKWGNARANKLVSLVWLWLCCSSGSGIGRRSLRLVIFLPKRELMANGRNVLDLG